MVVLTTAVFVLAAAVPSESAFGDLDVVRAMEAQEHGDDALALQLFERFIAGPSRGDMWLDARFLASKAALRAGKPARALELLEGLESDLPEIADYVLAARARSLRAAGRWEDAASCWQRLLDSFGDSPLASDARFGLADAAFARGDLTAAQIAYEHAAARAPNADQAMTARFNLGRIAEMQARWSEAASHYRALAYKNPAHPLHEPARAR
jgi:cellulose synthase operon protein C